jgi:hypothetical protein
MRGVLVSIGILAAIGSSALRGQTSTEQSAAEGEYQRAYAEAYNKSFRVAYRSNFVEQCVSSAPNATAAGYDISPTCSCAADTLLATKTVPELTKLSDDKSGAVIPDVMAQCLKSHPPMRAPKP